MLCVKTIINTCGGRGINIGGAGDSRARLIADGCTIYGCGNSGIESNANSELTLLNTILAENGNAAGEYNVEWTAGDAEKIGFHAWNVFYHSGGGGGANLLGLTANAVVTSSEFTTDPTFTNAAGADFSIGSSSPAKAAGFPGAFLGSSSTGYLDIGAVQRQEPAGGGATTTKPANMRGGMQ